MDTPQACAASWHVVRAAMLEIAMLVVAQCILYHNRLHDAVPRLSTYACPLQNHNQVAERHRLPLSYTKTYHRSSHSLEKG